MFTMCLKSWYCVTVIDVILEMVVFVVLGVIDNRPILSLQDEVVLQF